MYNPRAPPLAAVKQERETLCNEEDLNDMREDAVMSPAQFNEAVIPISPV